MPTDLNQNTPQFPQDDFDSMWGLHEPLRLPAGRAGWNNFEPLSVMDELQTRIRANDYAAVVGVPSKPEILNSVSLLIERFPGDFREAAESISPEGWRLLYYSSTYVLGCLAAYNFHARQELRHICEFDGVTDGLPAAWIGSDVEPRVIAQQTREVLDGLGSEPSTAAYAILAAAQRIGLSKSEILRCEWWSPGWIQNLSARLDAGG